MLPQSPLSPLAMKNESSGRRRKITMYMFILIILLRGRRVWVDGMDEDTRIDIQPAVEDLHTFCRLAQRKAWQRLQVLKLTSTILLELRRH